nr:MCE family protein [uncultured Fluviicola sp.]
MKQLFLISSFLILLSSCSEDPNRELVISFESASGLEEGDDVVLREHTIGEVTKIDLDDEYRTAVHIHLEKVKRLPRDSKFLIGAGSLFSNAVYVIPGKSKSYLTSSDKIIGSEKKDLQMHTLINKFIEKLPEPAHKEDSVIKELRDIKQEIHEVNEKTK